MVHAKSEHKELLFNGIAVSPGIVIGKAFVLYGDAVLVEPRPLRSDQVEAEVEKLHKAVERTADELQVFRTETAQRLGEKDASIFDVHQMLLQDETVQQEIVQRIRSQKINADHVVSEIIGRYEASFNSATDEYFRARAADLRDIKQRVIRHIQGKEEPNLAQINEPVVLIARDLTPSQTVSMDRKKILGFGTELGSRTSHAAILARSLKVPSIVGLVDACQQVLSNDTVILDGNSGVLLVNPTPDTLTKYKRLQREFSRFENGLVRVKRLPARTKDGKDLELSANIEFYEELQTAQEYGAHGVGLYRTEYLYLTRPELPTEEQQVTEYSRIIKAVKGAPVTVRTFDIGGDKAQKFFSIPHEANPFLGFRGVRLYERNEPVFLTQIRAILRASVHGQVRIMFPMIASVSEMRYCRAVVQLACEQLRKEGIAFSAEIPVGAMIEVPSAAVSADLIARESDFLSIGTNDLIQYTMAVDRGNKYVAYLYRNFNPAVLRLIRDVIRFGHEQGVWVGMCGEMASDPFATMVLIGLGLDEFSVSPVSLLVIKEIIRRVEFTECQNLALAALSNDTPDAVENYLLDVMKRKFKDLLFTETV
jgi:phosphoenolpyruvate-protein phosphotransferase (PTS system enzyme I)